MDGSVPVLTERSDIRLWKRLVALEDAATKGSKKNVEKLRKIVGDILKKDDYANPKILSKVIDLVDLYLSDEMQMILLELLEKCKLTDSRPQIDASEKLVAIGSYDSAKLILDRMTVITDLPRWEYLRGLVDLYDGDRKSARDRFVHAYELDDLFMPVYNELEQLEPNSGWECRGMIAAIMSGKVSDSSFDGGKGNFWELYNAYWEWSNGGGPNAMETLKRIIRKGIENDVELAIARMYFSNNDFQESIEHYRLAAEDKTFYIMLELADACYMSGNFEDARDVCSELEAIGVGDRRLVEAQIRIMTAMKDRGGLMKYVGIYLYNDFADFNAYVRTINALIKLQMHSEATGFLTKLSDAGFDDPIIDLLSSKNDYEAGRYATARASAKRVVRKMPDDVEGLLHISRVYLSMGRYDKSSKFIESILRKDQKNRGALILKKEVIMAKNPPDYKQAYEVCRKIISFYPDDAETMRDSAIILGKMGRDDEALSAYKASLSVKENPKLFMEILTSLVKAGSYDDVVRIAKEYDDVYGRIVDMWVIRGNSEYAIGAYANAAESFSKAVELDHNDPVIWHSKGLSEEMSGDYEQAEISYDRAVLMDLDNPVFWISKSAAQEKKGDYSGAINSLNRVISEHPENTYSLMKKASILVRLGREKEARTFVELASQIEPFNTDIMTARRDLYSREGDLDATAQICRFILATDPDDKRTVIILAETYMKLGFLEDAREILVRMNIDKKNFSDDDYRALQIIREIYHIQGKSHEEISACKTILSFRPDDREVKSALAEAYIKRNMIDAAKSLYDELHLLSPEDAAFSLKKAKMSGDDASALSVLMESLTRDPDNKEILLEVSSILSKDGKDKDSLEYVNRAIDTDPSDPIPYLRKMELLYKMGNHRGVLTTASIATQKVRRMDPILWKCTGDSQLAMGDFQNALISYDTAMKMGASSAEIYRSRGMCQEATGLDDAAISSYSMASQIDSRDVVSRIRAAAVFLTQGRDMMAVRMFDQVMELDPTSPTAIIAKATVFASKGNETGVKKVFDHCVLKGADERTKQTVAELLYRMKSKEVIALPVIPLEVASVMKPSEKETAPQLPVAEGGEVIEEEPESPAEDAGDEASEDVGESDEDALGREEEDSDDQDFDFLVFSSIPEEEDQTSPHDPEGDGERSETPVVPKGVEVEEDPGETHGSSGEYGPVGPSDERTDDDTETGSFEISGDDGSEGDGGRQEDVPDQVEAGSDDPEAPDGDPIDEYALRLLKCAQENGEGLDDGTMISQAGIPDDMVDKVFDYLSDIEDYGKIVPGTDEFNKMEDLSFNAIILSDADDIEEDPVISLTSAFYQSGAEDIVLAKRLVAYVYEAMTCELGQEPFDDEIQAIVDKVEFQASPRDVFNIMKKHRIGVYSARLVKKLAFREDGSVISHI